MQFDLNWNVHAMSDKFSPSILLHNVTGPGKQVYLHKIHLFVLWNLSPVLYLLSKICQFIEFLMSFCVYDDILDKRWITDKKFLHFKLSKSGHILRVDKTSFPRLGHIYIMRLGVEKNR